MITTRPSMPTSSKPSLKTPTAVLFAALVTAGLAPSAHAFNGTWNKTVTGTYDYNLGTNFTSSVVANGASSTLTIANSNGIITANQNLVGLTLGGITKNSSTGAVFTLSGANALTVDNGGPGTTATFASNNNGTNANMIDVDLVLTSNLVVQANVNASSVWNLGATAGVRSITGAGNLTFVSTVGASPTVNMNVSTTGAIINNSTGGTVTLAGTIGNGVTGITQSGTGTTKITGVSSSNGTTTINAGTVTLNKQTGALGSAAGLTLGGSGTFNMDNVGATTALTQNLGALTLSGGDATVKETRTAAFDQLLTFSALAARTTGATANLSLNTGTASATNGFAITSQATGFIDRGVFFGGNAYAVKDSTGFIRGLIYGTDVGSVTSAATTSLASATHQQITGAISTQNTATFSTLKISSNNNLTLAAAQTVTVDGILKSGGNASTISGGAGIQASTDSELVIRTDASGDALTINSAILANGANALTKTGAGTLTLGGVNTYTGATTVNAGTLNLAGGSSIGSVALTGGNLTLSGSTALSLGAINGAGTGTITVNNTFASGSTLTFANGSSFAAITPGANSVFTLNNGGGTTSFTNFLMFDNAGAGTGATTTLDGGTWNAATMGSNSGSSRFGGTLNIINGAVLNAAAARFAAHGTTNIGGSGTGTMNIGAGQWTADQTQQAFTYNVQNGGTLTSASAFTISLKQAALVSAKANSINISSGGRMSTTGTLTIGDATAITSGSETNTLNLSSGGKLLVNNTLSFGSTTSGAINTFNWSGQLTAKDVTTANMASGTLTNSAGIFAPGDIGFSGKTTVTGNFTQTTDGTLAIDLGGSGVNASAAFQDVGLGKFDLLAITGTANLGGHLTLSLLSGYTPIVTNSFKILTAGTSVTGTFLEGSSTTVNDGTNIYTFGITYNSKDVILTLNSITASAVPEPSTYAMLAGLSILGLAVYRRRKTS